MRLNSSQIILNLCYQAIEVPKIEFLTTHQDHNNQTYSIVFKTTTNKKNFVIMQPSSDDAVSPDNKNIGTKELSETLDAVKALQKVYRGNTTFFLPLAECRGRSHWTLLTIKNEQVNFYDPKKQYLINCCCFFKCGNYDLLTVQRYLNNKGFILEDKYYTDIQPFLNNSLCGYIVVHIASVLFKLSDKTQNVLSNDPSSEFVGFDTNNPCDFSNNLEVSYPAIYNQIKSFILNCSFSNMWQTQDVIVTDTDEKTPLKRGPRPTSTYGSTNS